MQLDGNIRLFLKSLPSDRLENFHFHHLLMGFMKFGGKKKPFTDHNPLDSHTFQELNSDHLRETWEEHEFLYHNCSNNYGPYHFPEKN